MKAKRILALFLALLMVVGYFPFTLQTARAASSGTGTAADPYQIWTADDLNNVRNDLNAHYILCDDIDLSAYPNWVPLGDAQNPFTGRLDGNSHTISGLKIGSAGAPSTAYSHTGLFGYINQYGVVHDLGVDVTIYNDSGYDCGGIAGKSEGYLVNCHTSGMVVSTAVDCNTGGIVGENAGNLVNCYNTANITGGSRKALDLIGTGGIAGINTGVNGITNCYNAGGISSSQGEVLGKLGTIVGYSYRGTLWNCYWDSEVCLGKTAGYDTGDAINSAVLLGLTTAYMKGAATPPERLVCKVIGLPGTLMNVTGYVFDITGKKTLISSKFADLMNGGRGAIKPEQLPSGVKASAWGQDSTNINNGYPVFTTASTSGVFSGGSGIITDPYIITKPEQLLDIKNHIVNLCTTYFDDYTGFVYLAPLDKNLYYLPDAIPVTYGKYIGGYYKLANDLDLSSAKTWDGLDNIDSDTCGFNGELDGNGYRLLNFSGLSYANASNNTFTWGALFKNIGPYGVVKNLGIDCKNAVSDAALTLYNYGLITNCQITGTIVARGGASVFCQRLYGDIINCYSSADITSVDGMNGQSFGLFVEAGEKQVGSGSSGSGYSFKSYDGFAANCAYTGNQLADSVNYGFAGSNEFPGIPGIINCYFAGNEETVRNDYPDLGPYAWGGLSLEVESINCYFNTSASYKRAGVEVAKQLAYYVGAIRKLYNLPIGLSADVMKGNTDTTIEYYDTTNNIAPPQTTNSFLDALNNGRSAVGKQFEFKTVNGSSTYDQQASDEDLFPWVYAPGINKDYPIPFKPQAPEITAQVSGKTITSGDTVTFHTAADPVRDGGTLSYQWQKSSDGATWMNVADGTGAASATYTTGTLSASNSKEKYRCVITNTQYAITNSVATNAAVVTVKPSIYPLNPTLEAGNAVTFGVDGAGPYQWQISADGGIIWNNITNATLSYYTTAALNSGDNGSQYRCVINGTPSAATTVTVTTATVSVTGVTVTPNTTSVQKGSTYTFAAAVTGIHNSQDVTWSVEGKSSVGTSISASGVLMVASDETGTLTVRATSKDNPAKSGTASVTLTEVPATVSSVTITPGTATVIKGGSSFTFSATVTGTNDPSQAVTWSISGNNSMGTTVSPAGELIVASNETAAALNVTAVSNIDSSKFGTAAVTVTSPAVTVSNVTITPHTASVAKGSTYTFSATVNGTNSPSQTVIWSVYGNNNPATLINSSGVLAVAAGETATALTVTATSVADGTVSGSAIVTVTNVVSTDPTVDAVTINPPTASVVKGGTATFTAVVAGSNNPAQTVNWAVYGKTSAGTSISSDGLLTVGGDETATTLTVLAKSNVDNSKFSTATVTVTSPAVTVSNVTITPHTVSIAKGSTYTFGATVNGTNNPSQAVGWSVSGNNKPGTIINSSGMLAVAAGETATTLTVTATSALDGSKSGTATVTVSDTASDVPTIDAIMVNPATASVEKGGTKSFIATVTGSNSPNQTVTWSVSGNTSTATAINSNGLLTVGTDETATTVTVSAVSTADISKAGTAAVTVTNTSLPAPTVSSVIVSTIGSSVLPGATTTFTAVVSGLNNPAQTVTWSVYGKNSANTMISSTGELTVGSDETAATLTITATATVDTTKSGTATVTVTHNNNTNPSTGGGGGGGSTSSTTSYSASVNAGGSDETTLPVTVNKDNRTASVDAGSLMLISGGIAITMPSIPDTDTYSVGIQLSKLSTAGEQGTFTLKTNIGNITAPSDMLTSVTGIGGSKAEITISQGDKSNLNHDVKADIGDRPLVQLGLSIDGKQTDWNNANAPVTISIPYTPTADELENPESIVIWYISGSGNIVTVPNGHYDPTTGVVTFDTTHFSDYAVAYNKVSFNDVATGAWYSKAVSFIAARGITGGTGNGNYSPDAKLTRGDFLVILMKAYGIAPDGTSKDNFSDAGNTYYTGYLAAAKRLGITAGVGNNQYVPNRDITRQEMFTLLYNALKAIGQLPQGDSGKTLSDFTDAGQIASWAKDAMTLLVETRTVGGNNGALTPLSTTSRAEMAQVVYNLLTK